MNIVGLEGHEMVHFLSPEEYFFGTNYDINTGNEQGGVYNRNFASIRVQHVVRLLRIRAPEAEMLTKHAATREAACDASILPGFKGTVVPGEGGIRHAARPDL